MTAAAIETEAGAKTVWAIDASHSNIEFAVKHLMITTVRGRFADVAGTIATENDDPTTAKIDVAIQTASIDTRSEQRDAHLRSPDFFAAEQFPEMRFVSRKVEKNGDDFRVTGDLTIKDVTRQVVLDATFEGTAQDPWGGQRAGFSAKTKINRGDFGLTWNQALEAGGVVVGDEIKISIELEATKSV